MSWEFIVWKLPLFIFLSGWLQGYFLLRAREPSLLRAPPYRFGVLVPWPPPPSSLAPSPSHRPCPAHSHANSFFPGLWGLRGGVTDSAGSCFWKILPLTLHLSCPSSPHRRQGWGGLLAIYHLPLLKEEDRPAPGLPGGGLGLGRRSSHLISHEYLLRVSCVRRTAGPERRAKKRCHGDGGRRHPHPARNGEGGAREAGDELSESGASHTPGGSRSWPNSATGEFEMETYSRVPFDPVVPHLEIFLSE